MPGVQATTNYQSMPCSLKGYCSALGLLVCLSFTGSMVKAQASFSIGPQIGLNTSTINYSDSPTYITAFPPSYRVGVEIGLLSSIDFKHLSIQASILFSQKGYKVKDATVPSTNGPGSYNDKNRFNYLIVPVNIAYATRRDGQGLRVFAGPYLSLLVGGHYNSVYLFNGLPPIESEERVLGGDNTQLTLGGTDVYSKRLDVGLQTGVGYRYQNLLLEVNYSIGLRNLATSFLVNPTTIAEGTPYYNRSFKASLSYLFRTKK